MKTFHLRRMAVPCLVVVAFMGAGPAALAQPAAPKAAASPATTPAQLMRGVHRSWFSPQARLFVAQAQALYASLAALCAAPATGSAAALEQAREQWRTTATAWDRLGGVQVGPLIERRSARQIDFMPTRPEMIRQAIASAPASVAMLETIGTPAKGLPALEWLLWRASLEPGTPACVYAGFLATDVLQEAQILSRDFDALAARDLTDAEGVAATRELLNQWVAGLERLRWSDIEKPRLAGADARPGARMPYPRGVSGQTAARWGAHWDALHVLGSPGAPSSSGEGGASLEAYLRALGKNAVASQFAQAIARADKALHSLVPTETARLPNAVRALAAVKRLVESDMAPAMDISIGFSDADGD